MEQLTCKHCGAPLEKAESGEAACPVEPTATSLFCSSECRRRFYTLRAGLLDEYQKRQKITPQETNND